MLAPKLYYVPKMKQEISRPNGNRNNSFAQVQNLMSLSTAKTLDGARNLAQKWYSQNARLLQ